MKDTSLIKKPTATSPKPKKQKLSNIPQELDENSEFVQSVIKLSKSKLKSKENIKNLTVDRKKSQSKSPIRSPKKAQNISTMKQSIVKIEQETQKVNANKQSKTRTKKITPQQKQADQLVKSSEGIKVENQNNQQINNDDIKEQLSQKEDSKIQNGSLSPAQKRFRDAYLLVKKQAKQKSGAKKISAQNNALSQNEQNKFTLNLQLKQISTLQKTNKDQPQDDTELNLKLKQKTKNSIKQTSIKIETQNLNDQIKGDHQVDDLNIQSKSKKKRLPKLVDSKNEAKPKNPKRQKKQIAQQQVAEPLINLSSLLLISNQNVKNEDIKPKNKINLTSRNNSKQVTPRKSAFKVNRQNLNGEPITDLKIGEEVKFDNKLPIEKEQEIIPVKTKYFEIEHDPENKPKCYVEELMEDALAAALMYQQDEQDQRVHNRIHLQKEVRDLTKRRLLQFRDQKFLKSNYDNDDMRFLLYMNGCEKAFEEKKIKRQYAIRKYQERQRANSDSRYDIFHGLYVNQVRQKQKNKLNQIANRIIKDKPEIDLHQEINEQIKQLKEEKNLLSRKRHLLEAQQTSQMLLYQQELQEEGDELSEVSESEIRELVRYDKFINRTQQQHFQIYQQQQTDELQTLFQQLRKRRGRPSKYEMSLREQGLIPQRGKNQASLIDNNQTFSDAQMTYDMDFDENLQQQTGGMGLFSSLVNTEQFDQKNSFQQHPVQSSGFGLFSAATGMQQNQFPIIIKRGRRGRGGQASSEDEACSDSSRSNRISCSQSQTSSRQLTDITHNDYAVEFKKKGDLRNSQSSSHTSCQIIIKNQNNCEFDQKENNKRRDKSKQKQTNLPTNRYLRGLQSSERVLRKRTERINYDLERFGDQQENSEENDSTSQTSSHLKSKRKRKPTYFDFDTREIDLNSHARKVNNSKKRINYKDYSESETEADSKAQKSKRILNKKREISPYNGRPHGRNTRAQTKFHKDAFMLDEENEAENDLIQSQMASQQGSQLIYDEEDQVLTFDGVQDE